MRNTIKWLAALAFAAALCAAAGGFALASPAPTGVLAWEVTESKVMSDADPASYSGNVLINAKDSSGNPIVLDLNGKTVTINGNLSILGTLFVNNGSLTVTGNVEIMNGLLKMTESNSKLIVKGNFTTDARDETGMLTAGSLTVYGDLMQYCDFSRSSFCPSGAFTVTLTGTNKMLWFESPDGSWLNSLPPASVTLKAASVVSFNLSFAADKNFASPNSYPHLHLQGALNGKTVTVPDGTRISGMLMMGGGKLFAAGSLTVTGRGGLGMENAADYVEVAGSFTAGGRSDYKNGTLKVLGNFYQYSVLHDSSYRDDSYACLPAHRTVLVGLNKTVVFDTPASSYFGTLDNSAASFTSDSTISLNCDLSADASWSYPNLYYGGRLNGHRLTVAGDLHARTITLGGGALTVSNGSFTAVSENCLVMQNAADRVTVAKNFTSRYAMAPGSMTAGVLTIGGNFYQLGSEDAFTASGTHVTKFTGANKYVTFANPGSSYFNRLDLTGGVTFAPLSVLAVKCDLSADMTVGAAMGAPTLYYSGSMGGHSLAVSGSLHLFGAVDPQGGSINAEGNVTLDGALTMTQASDSLVCGGDFTGAGTAVLSAGTMEFRKSFRYTGASFDASGTNLAVLSGGSDMPVVFDRPEHAWFSRVSVAPGTALSAGSAVSVSLNGQDDLSVAAPTVYLQGNLNGHSAGLDGNLTVPPGCTLTLGGGNMTVSGNMTLNNGALVMTNAADRLTVGGSFSASGPDETGKLTEGVLSIKGDFLQRRVNSVKSFVGSGNHATVLCGSAPQSVSFETPISAPGAADGSTFGRLYLLNAQIQFTTACFCTNGDGSHGVLTSASLHALSGTGGTLVPALAAGRLDYVYVLPAGVTGTTITASKEASNATINGSGDTTISIGVTGVGYGTAGNRTVDITMRAADDIVVNHYTVKVEQLDTDLAGIGLSTGTLSPAFDAGTTGYSVNLPSSQGSITITPELHNEDSTAAIGGQAGPSRTYEPKPGETLSIPVVVTGQDGHTTRTYTVSVHREPMLSGIAKTAGTLAPSFQSPTQDYTLTLPATQSAVTLTAEKATGEGQGCDAITIDGQSGNSASYTLPVGGRRSVEITATAGDASFTYRITIQRSAIISGFGYYPTAGVTLSPAFSAEGGTYTLTIPSYVSSITIAPAKVDCSTLRINSAVRDSLIVSPPVGGSAAVSIDATAGTGPDALTVHYTLTVTRRAILTGLAPSAGTLSPAFNPTTLTYTVEQPATMKPLTLTPTLQSGSAYIGADPLDMDLWDPQSPNFVNPAIDPEPGGTGNLYVKVRDGDTSVTYTVSVHRQKPVTGITVSNGMSLSPAFNARIAEYTVMMPAASSSVTLTPVKSADCMALTINGVAQNSIALTPPIGGSAVAVIRATGAGNTITTYTVTVVREALLTDIKLSKGALSPAFRGGVANYSVYVPNATTSVTVTPQKAGACASFTINGKKVKSLKLAPKAGGSATATVVCTGASAGVSQTYTVTVYRIQPVTSIKVSAGKLSPAFSMTKGAYTVSVPANAKSVTVTPVTGASCASMLMDGQAVASKTLSPAIGCSASTTITAVSKDGQQFSYTVTVNRMALLKGITVPAGTSYSPAFSVTTMSYTMTVPATTASVKITPQKGSGAKTMKINGKTASNVTLKPVIGGRDTATVVVSDGKISQTYTLTVNRLPLLTGLAASAGTLSQAARPEIHTFDPAVTSYTVNLPTDTTGATLTLAQAASGVQSITMNGVQTLTLPVTVAGPGGTTTVTVVATASNGTTKATYTIAVKRNPIITNIKVGNEKLSPAFNPLKTDYTVSVPVTTSSVTLTPERGPECASASIDGSPDASRTYTLPVGGETTVEITGTTAGGLSCTYHVRLIRAPLISKLRTSTSAYPLSPAFSATTTNYTVTLPASRSSITIYATKAKGVKTLTLNGRKATSLTVKPPIGGSVPVTIVATATDGKSVVTYTVAVTRLPLLSGIAVTGGSLNTPFAASTHSYTVLMPASQASVQIAATGTSSAGTLKINGVKTSGATVSLQPGETKTVTILVYYKGSSSIKDTYTVKVTRATG